MESYSVDGNVDWDMCLSTHLGLNWCVHMLLGNHNG